MPDPPFRVLGVTNEHSGGKNKMAHDATHSAARRTGQTGNTDQDLSAMVASRICHDLVSPLGAIGNGLELMQLASSTLGPELSLVAQSTDSANARLRFYRIAFGIVSASQSISRAEILSILDALQPHQKHKVSWTCDTELTRQQVKLMFLLLMCLETTVPWGGEIVLRSAPCGVELVANAHRLRIEDSLWTALCDAGRIEDLTSAKIHFALAGAEIAAQGYAVSVTAQESSFAIRVALECGDGRICGT